MFAVIVNSIAIVIGSFIGIGLKRGVPKETADALMRGLGVCTILIGIQGAVVEKNILIMIISVVIGIFWGETIDLDGKVNRLAEKVTKKFTKKGNGENFANAFVTSCLIMNVGAMVIVGSLNAGLLEDFNMLYTKSLLDFISGIMLSAVMGAGVLGSAVFTLVFQGGIVIFAENLAPILSNDIINELNSVGSLIIIALGFNMTEITKFKVINYLPALVITPILMMIMRFL
ncbi:MAG: DUF554 domain-containing protein [Selenomonadaceae bacterium]|nr:DUF554 domain-containing protein [Selenomonadaceae bacterium]